MNGLYKLWIIHRDAGLCIFEQTFAELPKQISSDMIGGFLMAILSFGQEIANQEIEYIQMKEIRITYHITPKFVIAVGCNDKTNAEDLEKAVQKVENRFTTKYSSVLEGRFSGNTTIFQDFGKEVEEIMGSKSTALKFLEQKVESVKMEYQQKRDKLKELAKSIFTPEMAGEITVHIVDMVEKLKVPFKKLGGKTKELLGIASEPKSTDSKKASPDEKK